MRYVVALLTSALLLGCAQRPLHVAAECPPPAPPPPGLSSPPAELQFREISRALAELESCRLQRTSIAPGPSSP